MSAPATHACVACGGAGQAHEHTFQCFETLCLAGGRCPVCLGAGRISDRMPAADALADAETLLRVAADDPSFYRDEHAALFYGNATAQALRSKASAKVLARAAFRAVPGLRGDR